MGQSKVYVHYMSKGTGAVTLHLYTYKSWEKVHTLNCCGFGLSTIDRLYPKIEQLIELQSPVIVVN